MRPCDIVLYGVCDRRRDDNEWEGGAVWGMRVNIQPTAAAHRARAGVQAHAKLGEQLERRDDTQRRHDALCSEQTSRLPRVQSACGVARVDLT